jgi:hypothetical protein
MGGLNMNVRKLCAHGAVAAMLATGVALKASPAEARLVCNQYGHCHWTGDTPRYQRENSNYYESKWNVQIHNGRHDNDNYYNDWRGDRRYHDWRANYGRGDDRNRDYDDNDQY